MLAAAAGILLACEPPVAPYHDAARPHFATSAISPVPAWFSDWSAASGSSTEALLDNGKWNGELCHHPVASVVPATGLDFPDGMEQVLLTRYGDELQCRMIRTTDQWPAPQVGQTIHYRIYHRNALANQANVGQAHPIQSGGHRWSWAMRTASNDTSLLVWEFPNQNYPDTEFFLGLPTGRTWRLEWSLQRTSETTAKVAIRIYDGADTLVYDTDDFVNERGQSLALRDPDLLIGNPQEDFQSLVVGNNGTGVATQPAGNVYWGGSAVCLDEWCGPYLTGTTPGADSVPRHTTYNWSSDWSANLGTGIDALRDGGKWTGELCDHPVAAVVPAAGLDFPPRMANVYRSEYGPAACRMVQATNQWPAPEIGQTVYYRLYYRNALADGANIAQAHPVQASSIAWWWGVRTASNGASMLVWNFPNQPYPNNKFYLQLPTHRTWRLEWALHRTASDAAQVTIRISDSTGTPRYGNDDFRSDAGQALSAVNPTLRINDVDRDFRTMEIGNNDVGVTTSPSGYIYWGGVAVDLTDWAGEY